MKYPWKNELFLSDHCSCDENAKIAEDEILGVHEIDFHGASASPHELFCRQTYVHKERKWVTLEEGHLLCEHIKQKKNLVVPKFPVYRPGDTLLVHLDKSGDISEPCELVSSHYHIYVGTTFRL